MRHGTRRQNIVHKKQSANHKYYSSVAVTRISFLQKKTFHVGTLLGILFNIKDAIFKELTFPFFALIIIFFSDFGCTFIYKQRLLSERVPAQDVLVNIVSN